MGKSCKNEKSDVWSNSTNGVTKRMKIPEAFMEKGRKNEEPNKCTTKKEPVEMNPVDEIMENPHSETAIEPDVNESELFYESVTNFLADYQNKTITDKFYRAVEEFELHYYIATAIRLIMSTRNINAYAGSNVLNDAIDLLVRWQGHVKDNKCPYRSNIEVLRFADAAFSDPHDKRHIAIGLIIKAATTPDNDLCDIYLIAAITLLRECVVLDTKHSIESR